MTDHDITYLDDGTVRIGAARGCAAGCAALDLPGGSLLVDPLNPAAPWLELSDPDQSQEAVLATFGMRAWDAVAAEAAGPMSGVGWALVDASRLALIRWLTEYSPDPLDDDLLAAEAAVLTDRLSPFLPAAKIPTRLHNRAIAEVEAVLQGVPAGAPAVRRLFGDLMEILAARGDPQAHDLAARLADHRDQEPTRPLAEDWPLGTVLIPLGAGLTLDDAALPPQPPSGQCSTDWDLVPRGAFDADEDCIRWRIGQQTPNADPVVHVEARAGWDPRGEYLARLLSPAAQVPLAVVALRLDAGLWIGSAPLLPPTADLSGCWVDITSAQTPRPARRGTARAAASGRRWASRGLTRLRYGLADGQLLDSAAPLTQAVGSLERARLEYADLTSRTQDAAARRRHFELGLTLRSALGWRGEHYEVDDLEHDLAAEAQLLAETDTPPLPPDPAPLPSVDLEHPAWGLTVAESAMLVPTE